MSRVACHVIPFKCPIFFIYFFKETKLVSGGSVINGAYPIKCFAGEEKLYRLLPGLLAAPPLQGLQEPLPPRLRIPGAQLQSGLGLLLGQRDLRGSQVRAGEDVPDLGHLLHHDRRDRLRVRPSPGSPSVSGREDCQHLMEDCVD